MTCVHDKIDKVAKGTEDIVGMWNGGVKAVRFFCRLAEAWRFLMRQVLYQFGLPIVLIYGIWYLHDHDQLPTWIVAGLKFFTQVF